MERDRSSSVMVGKLFSRIDAVIGRAGGGEPVRLKRGRKVVAVLVSPEDAELLAREKREMEADIRAYDRAKREIERDGSDPMPWEDVKREFTARRERKS
jgi:hypothetical protein